MPKNKSPKTSGPHWGKLAMVISINAVVLLAAATAIFVMQPLGDGLDVILAEVMALAGLIEIGVAVWFWRRAADQ